MGPVARGRQPDRKNFAFPPIVLAEAGLRRLGSIEPAPSTDEEHRRAVGELFERLSESLDASKGDE